MHHSPLDNYDDDAVFAAVEDHKPSAPSAPKSQAPKFHIVFSTGCSAYQDWQSYAFFYQALQSKQEGEVTRVASGCDKEQAKVLQEVFRDQIKPMSDRFHLHLTPNFSKVMKGKDYKFFNKPFGLAHWFDFGIEYKKRERELEDVIFIILDPDQLILQPFVQDYTDEDEVWTENTVIHTAIRHGQPMSQMYMFGASWAKDINMTEILNSATEPSPVRTWTRQQIIRHYAAGPPYMATGRDMDRIVHTWRDIAVPVYKQTEDHLSEMFAYSVAAGHLDLPHQLSNSFMVSNVDIGDEGWKWINDMEPGDVCNDPKGRLPRVLHFCQHYAIGPWFFSKYRMPNDFLSCEAPLLAVPNSSVVDDYDYGKFPDGKTKEYTLVKRKRHAFMVCQLVAKLNDAATYFKKNHCQNEKANFAKTHKWVSES